ncbi:MAG: Fic family protein [Gammaproteobacteria bacterium]|nr:Fic family protein [Gammaproteobacteria bacterium]MDH5727641.1 Fic family protein [Gammaproteobacteria bacterium]
MKYNWQQPDWTDFNYDIKGVQDILFAFAEKTGQVNGIMKSLPGTIQTDAVIDIMVSEAIKTSAIEGENLSRSDVMSSIRHNLGLDASPSLAVDRRAKGVADLMVDVRHSFQDPLTEATLFKWHEMLMSGQRRNLPVGMWRSHKEPMQVISGVIGKWKVHFEAPPSDQVPQEMIRFIDWFNKTAPSAAEEIKNPVIRSAIAHLYFESIHPFEDGNGRIGRAISEKALSQGLGRPTLLSLSDAIETKKKDYYSALMNAQKSNEITHWIKYFSTTVLSAQMMAEEKIEFILNKTKFLDHFKDQLNDRQLKVIHRMFDAGVPGFDGGMTQKKYVAITKTSTATATRDLKYLADIGALKQVGGGRSTRYEIDFCFNR